MHEEDLAVPEQLPAHRRGDLPLVVRADERQHRVPFLRRGQDRRHLPDPRHAHLQGARDRRRGHAEHVHLGPQPLEVLLVLDAEPLLLVDDHQAEALEAGLRRQQLVRADDHVDVSLGQATEGFRRLRAALEPGQRPDLHGERRVPLAEGREVLLDEQRRRHQDRDLHAVLNGLERRAHRDLRLTVADVAADQPVHRHRALHVGLDLVDGRELVARLHVGKRVLQLTLPGRVGAEGVPGRRGPGRVEPDQLRGDLADRLARAPLGLGPVRPAQAVQARRLTPGVLGDLVELVGRHVQPVRRLTALAGRVLDDQVLPGRAGRGPAGHLHVPADTVLLVHHVVARGQLQRVDATAPPARHPAHVLGAGPAARLSRQVVFCQDGELDGRPGEPVLQQAGRHIRHARLGRSRQLLHAGAETFAAQHLGQPLRRAVPLGHEDDPPAAGKPLAHVRDHAVRSAAIAPRRCRIDTERTTSEAVLAVRVVPGTERLDRPPRQTAGPAPPRVPARSAGTRRRPDRPAPHRPRRRSPTTRPGIPGWC